eukprot:s2322_g2.t1
MCTTRLCILGWFTLFAREVLGAWDDEDDDWSSPWRSEDQWENQWNHNSPSTSWPAEGAWGSHGQLHPSTGVTLPMANDAGSSSSSTPLPPTSASSSSWTPLPPTGASSSSWTPSSISPVASGVNSPDNTWKPWSNEEIMQRMAERWDENISLALQEEAVQKMVAEGVLPHPLPPIREELPLPFATTNDDMNRDVTWWDKVRDRRLLRGREGFELRARDIPGRGDHPSSTSASSSTCSSTSSNPEPEPRARAPQFPRDDRPSNSTAASPTCPSTWSAPSLAATPEQKDPEAEQAIHFSWKVSVTSDQQGTPAEATGSSSSWEPMQWDSAQDGDQGRAGTAASTEPTQIDNTAGEGITQRWGVMRPGVDRWHYPNGTIRCRLRQRQAAEQARSGEAEPRQPFDVTGVAHHAEGPALKASTFYGEQFQVWASTSSVAAFNEEEASTTAGESCLADTEEGWTSSSSSHPPDPVGFYKHGVWQPRPRTPSELRSHQGGNGVKRQQRRAECMAAYLAGSWKPAWLVQYVKDREARQASSEQDTSLTAMVPAEDEKVEEATTSQNEWEGQQQTESSPLEAPTGEEVTQGGVWETNATDLGDQWEWAAWWRASSWTAWSEWSEGEWRWQQTTTSTSTVNGTEMVVASDFFDRSEFNGDLLLDTQKGALNILVEPIENSHPEDPPNEPLLELEILNYPDSTALSVDPRDLGTLGVHLPEFVAVVELLVDLVHAGVNSLAWATRYVAWTATSTTSTTSTTTDGMLGHLPNEGLFPVVNHVDRETFGRMAITNSELATLQEETFGRMAITNSELATLQEYGVSRAIRQRLEQMLQAFDRHEQQGTGPESRWALECLVRRVSEGADAQQAILQVQVLRRRLVPRGLLPVTRVPRDEQQRWNVFSWVRQFLSLFADNLESHMRTPLQPVETNRSSSSEHGGRSRSRSRNRSPEGSLRSQDNVSLHSDLALNSDGEEVIIPDAAPGEPRRGPPPPLPVQWAPVELQGIWREPEPEPTQEHDPSASSSSFPSWTLPTSSTTSTTTSSTTSMMTTSGTWEINVGTVTCAEGVLPTDTNVSTPADSRD